MVDNFLAISPSDLCLVAYTSIAAQETKELQENVLSKLIRQRGDKLQLMLYEWVAATRSSFNGVRAI